MEETKKEISKVKKEIKNKEKQSPANKIAEDIEMKEIASSTVGNDYNGKEDFEIDIEYIERENYFVRVQIE
ncbi:5188_t:CDS:2, partial [Gigaspora margarita]